MGKRPFRTTNFAGREWSKSLHGHRKAASGLRKLAYAWTSTLQKKSSGKPKFEASQLRGREMYEVSLLARMGPRHFFLSMHRLRCQRQHECPQPNHLWEMLSNSYHLNENHHQSTNHTTTTTTIWKGKAKGHRVKPVPEWISTWSKTTATTRATRYDDQRLTCLWIRKSRH